MTPSPPPKKKLRGDAPDLIRNTGIQTLTERKRETERETAKRTAKQGKRKKLED